jgi:cysteinyl-tRNA synthetase
MSIALYNARTKIIEPLIPLRKDLVRIYSCGPTVYDTVHIGNLSAFIIADTLRRIISVNNLQTHHVMNFTDVDDKTIKRSQQDHPDKEPLIALKATTTKYEELFLKDIVDIGINADAIEFIRATDPATITAMKELVAELYEKGIAYIADDGVYFSIDSYKNAGRTYGQLVQITQPSSEGARIDNDEYDKDEAHDFALWKVQKAGEPAWGFTLNSIDLTGRPGWHLECSAMSRLTLGQPFDIHTGGIDLAFPHHENEIAQSTATSDSDIYATFFCHNEHILVDGKKMSKSLQNFYTLNDLRKQGIDPLAFRLLVLQSHYRKPTNFSFKNAAAAKARLKNWQRAASLRHQIHHTLERPHGQLPSFAAVGVLTEMVSNDLDTPRALAHIDQVLGSVLDAPLHTLHLQALTDFIDHVDTILGIQLATSTPDISDAAKRLMQARKQARTQRDWAESDRLRDALKEQGIAVRDTPQYTVWEYI